MPPTLCSMHLFVLFDAKTQKHYDAMTVMTDQTDQMNEINEIDEIEIAISQA